MSAKHTPGPWRWELNEEHKTVHLVGGKPQYDKTVMQFERWGMQRAAPMFNDAIAGNQYNIMERVTKYGKPVPGRLHHASWFKDVDHPDARLIAAAPDLLSAVELFLKYDETESDQGLEMMVLYAEAREAARAAISKATGA